MLDVIDGMLARILTGSSDSVAEVRLVKRAQGYIYSAGKLALTV